MLAERLPAMCGSDTLTTLVSSTSMKVASITEMAMIHGLMFGCSSAMASKPSALVSPSPYLSRKDRWFSGESRPQQPLGILIGIQHDLDRHALHHLDEVPSRVFRRQQREPGAGGAGDAVDFAGEFLAADRVDLHGRPLARTHVLQLRLLEVRDDPHLVQRHDRHQRLARLDDLSWLDALSAHEACDRRFDGRVLKVELRLRELRSHLLRVGFGGGCTRSDRRNLLRRRLRAL